MAGEGVRSSGEEEEERRGVKIIAPVVLVRVTLLAIKTSGSESASEPREEGKEERRGRV